MSAISRGVRYASTSAKAHHKVVVVGGGSGGLNAANQVYNKYKSEGKKLNEGDIAVVDGSEFHHYQPGWTLVGAGLKEKHDLRRRLTSLIPSYIAHHPENVASFSPETSSLTTTSGTSVSYDTLIVAAGLKVNFDAIENLPKALADPTSGVSSIYSYETCDKAWNDISSLRTGKAVFTQPAGVIKCAGAPQKIMWMAWDWYRRNNRSDKIDIDFITGMPTMFSVKKYSDALNALRVERGVGGKFEHNLVSINPTNRVAVFKTSDGLVEKDYTILHVTPPMGPHDFIKNSPLADAAGWVDVDPATLQHKKPEFKNVFSLGDCSSLPTSKTAAAITAQSPVLVENLTKFLETGEVGKATYDGYTSCPLLTGYGELMLAEFVYGLKPKETFHELFGIDQVTPRRAFYHLKKDFFPWVYYDRMVNGRWFGPKGLSHPTFPS